MSYYKQKRLIISEQERNDILSKYGILNEVNVKVNDFTLQVGSRGFFANGKWKNLKPEAQAEFEKDREATKNFVKEWGNIPGYIIEVKIEASESQVTNYDREVEGNVRLKKGELSTRRAATMKRILTELFESYLKEGIIKEMPVFTESVIKIGETPYIRGTSNPKDPIYDKERYVFYSLKAVRKKDPIKPTPKPKPTPKEKIVILFISNADNLEPNRLIGYIKPGKRRDRDDIDSCKEFGWGLYKGCSGRVGNDNAEFKVYLGDTYIETINMSGPVGKSVIRTVTVDRPDLIQKLKNGESLNLNIRCTKTKGTINFGFKIITYDDKDKPKVTFESCLPIKSYLATDNDLSAPSILNNVRLGVTGGKKIDLGMLKDFNGNFELANVQTIGFSQHFDSNFSDLYFLEFPDSGKTVDMCPRAKSLDKL